MILLFDKLKTSTYERLESLLIGRNIEIRYDPKIHRRSFIVGSQEDAIIVFNLLHLTKFELNFLYAHELGHYFTDTICPASTSLEIRRQNDIIANRWALEFLIPKEELDQFYSCFFPWAVSFTELPQTPNWLEEMEDFDAKYLIEEYNLYDLLPAEENLTHDSMEERFNILLASWFQVPIWVVKTARIYYLKAENNK